MANCEHKHMYNRLLISNSYKNTRVLWTAIFTQHENLYNQGLNELQLLQLTLSPLYRLNQIIFSIANFVISKLLTKHFTKMYKQSTYQQSLFLNKGGKPSPWTRYMVGRGPCFVLSHLFLCMWYYSMMIVLKACRTQRAINCR